MLVHPQFDPIAFTIGPFTIASHTFALPVRWYGLMYLGRVRAVRGAGQAARAAEPAHRLASARRRRHAVLRRARRDHRRPAGIRAVLQAALLPRASARDPVDLAGRNELPRRVPWRPGRAPALRAASRQALARRHRFRGAADPARARRRPHRQFHQRRTVGARHGRALGHGVPASGTGAAASVAALSVRRRGPAACSPCCGSSRGGPGRWERPRACS